MEKTPNQENFHKPVPPPKISYVIEDNVLEKFEVDKNVFLRIIQADDLYIDVRKFYKNFPTRQGIRFKLSILEQIKDKIKQYLN